MIGYVECDDCGAFTYLCRADEITIWYHPDDPKPVAEAYCAACDSVVSARIDFDHMANFKRYGCKVVSLHHKFEELTEEAIDEWDIDSELQMVAE